MQQEADTIHIFEQSLLRSDPRPLRNPVLAQFCELVVPIESGQFCDLPPVKLRSRKPQFLFEGLFQHLNVLVFAKDQGHNQPVIPRADLPVRSREARESRLAPLRRVRR